MAEEKKNTVQEEKIKRNSTGSILKDLMSGSMVTDKIILKNLWFIFLLTMLAALYIANRFHAERITRETTKLQREVRDLRSESLSTSASLTFASKQSEVLRLVREHGLDLEELKEPPFKLIVNSK
jgi:hypothetical protein